MTNRPKGFGFCEFADQQVGRCGARSLRLQTAARFQSAQNAINLSGSDFRGRVLRVNWANKAAAQ